MCKVPGCSRRDIEMIYYDRNICLACTKRDSEAPFLKQVLKIKDTQEGLDVIKKQSRLSTWAE